MAILISAHQLVKAFGPRPLFDGLTFAIESGERIGLIGPNGAGKSTLLRMIAGQASADSGTLAPQRGLRIGFLEQVPTFSPGATVQATVLEGCEDPHEWSSVAAAQEISSKLGLSGVTPRIGPETPVEQLSGGWRKRVALARELVRRPDLLLLDEPTNHLDVESILWLEDFLEHSSFATLTITHDRAFLQGIANRIIELDRRNPGGLLSIKGSYADYLYSKEQLIQSQESRELRLKNTLRRETEWLRQGAKARTTKQQARIQRADELKSQVSELEYRNQTKVAKLEFQAAERNPKKLLEARGISKSYGQRKIFSGLDLVLAPGSRVALLGPNGCGKSTLIRVLLGEEDADSGEVKRSDQLQVAYFDQNRESLDSSIGLAKTLCPVGEWVDYRGTRLHIRSYLDRFLFDPGQAEITVGKLSGGEQSRLLLAKLMLREGNLLVLDEPTNDLDVQTLNVLQDCLTDFPGSVLLVSHDRYFIDQVATQLLAFDPGSGETANSSTSGKIVKFADLAQWESWHALRLQEQELATRPSEPKPEPSVPAAVAAKKKKLSYKDQRELDGMEETIQKAETELARLTEETSKPEIMGNASKLSAVSAQLSAAQAEVDRLYARWAELSES